MNILSPREDTVQRIARIMEAICTADDLLSLREIEEQTGIPRATVHRFLHSLKRADWVYQDPATEKFRTGIRFFLLFDRHAYYDELVQICYPHMKKLLAQTGRTILLSVLDGTVGRCILSAEPATALKFVAHKGMNIPLYAGATGKILLAYAKPEIQERVLAQKLVPFTEKTKTDPHILQREIEQIQKQAYAFSQEEWMTNAGDLSVPIFDHRGQFVCQLGIAGLSSSFEGEVENLLILLKEAVSAISPKL
ncbi:MULTISPECIES: IclR family transcriptional regulator [Aminobacterium]|jgi:DNA-binding IclR family transcriptional regulator|uniref:IclR family transcriptional regulator n=3 Tax=Aminobacteriaceae TaxID=3029087 RepID=UPI00258019AC|nr:MULTISPECIES: IclR family transcriptional regulator [unclassified Aminobacterium]